MTLILQLLIWFFVSMGTTFWALRFQQKRHDEFREIIKKGVDAALSRDDRIIGQYKVELMNLANRVAKLEKQIKHMGGLLK